MTTFDTLIEHNSAFAAQRFAASATLQPTLEQTLHHVKGLVIGCADPRVDPELVLGLNPGEFVVLRNIGGRVTPGTLQMMGLLNRIAEVARENPGAGGEFHLIVLQHTDCGMLRLADSHDMLTSYFSVGETDLAAKAITDPRKAIAADVATLKAVPALPGEWLISGLLYDVTTGRVDTVIPPAPLR